MHFGILSNKKQISACEVLKITFRMSKKFNVVSWDLL